MQRFSRKQLVIAGAVLLVIIAAYLLLKPSSASPYCDNPDEFGYCTEDYE